MIYYLTVFEAVHTCDEVKHLNFQLVKHSSARSEFYLSDKHHRILMSNSKYKATEQERFRYYGTSQYVVRCILF